MAICLSLPFSWWSVVPDDHHHQIVAARLIERLGHAADVVVAVPPEGQLGFVNRNQPTAE
jgi:hypothetical protein